MTPLQRAERARWAERRRLRRMWRHLAPEARERRIAAWDDVTAPPLANPMILRAYGCRWAPLPEQASA